FELRAIFDDPPVNGGVIHLYPPFLHEFFDMARAQRIRHIPADPHHNDLWGEMRPFETDSHRRAPSRGTVGQRARSYCIWPQRQTCDKTDLDLLARHGAEGEAARPEQGADLASGARPSNRQQSAEGSVGQMLGPF